MRLVANAAASQQVHYSSSFYNKHYARNARLQVREFLIKYKGLDSSYNEWLTERNKFLRILFTATDQLKGDVVEAFEKELVEVKRKRMQEVYDKEHNTPQPQIKFFENTNCCLACSSKNLPQAVEHNRKDIVEKILAENKHIQV